MGFSFIQISGIIASFQLFISGFYFIHINKKRESGNVIFALLLFVYAIMIICSLVLTGIIDRPIFLYAHMGNQVSFLIGPLLYFYIKSRLDASYTPSSHHLYHIIPFGILILYLCIKFYFIKIPISCRLNHNIIGTIAFIHLLIYFIKTLRYLKTNNLPIYKISQSCKENSSVVLYYFMIGCTVVWLIKLITFIVWDMSDYGNGVNEFVNLFFLISFLFFNALMYVLLLNPHFFLIKRKYKDSPLSKHEKEGYKQKLISFMETEKIYSDPLLTLKKLAKYLEIPERTLSQVINESCDSNFYDFINAFRIRETMNYLSNEEYADKSILHIAYDVGFSSKSTFNAAFKKHTNTTPRDYRRNVLLPQEKLN